MINIRASEYIIYQVDQRIAAISKYQRGQHNSFSHRLSIHKSHLGLPDKEIKTKSHYDRQARSHDDGNSFYGKPFPKKYDQLKTDKCDNRGFHPAIKNRRSAEISKKAKHQWRIQEVICNAPEI